MTYLLHFELKGLPKMTNNLRGHWRKAQGNATRWKRLVWAKSWHLKPETPLEKARITLVRFSSVEPDHDGLVSGFKPIIDGLVDAGILANDKPSNIGTPEYRWVKVNPKAGRIAVKVEALAAEEKHG